MFTRIYSKASQLALGSKMSYKLQRENFFLDGKRLVDYTLVYSKENSDVRRLVFLSAFLELGGQIEEVPSMITPDIIFIKVHLPVRLVYKYADKYEIPLKCLQRNYIRAPVPKLKFMRTEVTSQDPFSSNFFRAPETMSGNQPKNPLRYERMLVTYNILKRIVYGADSSLDVGIDHLLENEVFIAAFPPHDGPSTWDDDEMTLLNDRQLLRRYWSHPRNFFKAQPLDLIERYFGGNIALYFAWMSFYNKMLLIPIIFAIITTCLNFVHFESRAIIVKEACRSEQFLCPSCRDCSVTQLKDECLYYRISYFTDNTFTIIFAVLMSFWADCERLARDFFLNILYFLAIVYMILWRRQQAILTIRWNNIDSELEEQDIRPEFENFAKYVRLSVFGEPELYIPTKTRLWRKMVAITVCVIMIAIVFLINLIVVIIDVKLRLYFGGVTANTVITALITVVNIIILRSIYEPIVIKLVNLEIPQTQTDFDNSYILKVFLFSFVNNYTSLLYTSFIRGKLYTHPNDPVMYNSNLNIITDYCSPAGCIPELNILFPILFVFLPVLSQSSSYISGKISRWFSSKKEKSAHVSHTKIPRWEKDFELEEAGSDIVPCLYEEMVLQFGYLTLFACAFPVAPIFALVYNTIKIHIDAYTLVVKKRRPPPRRTCSIGAWLDIMKFLTFFSIVTTACFTTFTSHFISKNYYLYRDSDLKGYVNFTLSTYKINIDHWPKANVPNGTICWYFGYRNPPEHSSPYELSFENYHLLTIRVAIIVIFEHTLWLLATIVAYSIPAIPSVVREKYAEETMELRKFLLSTPKIVESVVTLK